MIRECVICGALFEARGPKKTCGATCSKILQVENTAISHKRARQLAKDRAKKNSKFSSFEHFVVWAKSMLAGIDLDQYKAKENTNGQA